MKTEATIIKDYKGNFKKGESGYIDGYVNGSSGAPCAVMVSGKKFDAVPLFALET